MMKANIGVSGWQYPDFEARFYPQGLEKRDQLAFYAQHFPTVEINNTFYHLPRTSTVENWRRRVPEGFTFAVKANRYITHMKNLLEPEKTLPNFYERINLLGERLGPVLFQLPPRWQMDLDRLSNFLGHLPGGYQHTIEFRNPNWHRNAVYDLLSQNGVAFCIYDFNYYQSPIITTADFVYIRLHGPGQAYRDPYDLDMLNRWADRIRGWVAQGKDVYCYFDNTFHGYAWENAKSLLEMLGE